MGVGEAALASSLMREIRELKRRVRQLENARGLESSSIGTGGLGVKGGSVRIYDVDGNLVMQLATEGISLEGLLSLIGGNGSIEVLDENGKRRVLIARGDTGGGQIETFHANGQRHLVVGDATVNGEPAGQIFALEQPDGKDVFDVLPLGPNGEFMVIAFDHIGTRQFQTDENGSGLDRPYLEVAMYPARSGAGDTDWALEDDTTWRTMWEGRLWVTHRAVDARAFAWAPSGEGEIRLQIDNVTVGNVESVTSTSGSYFDFGGAVPVASGIGTYSFVRVAIQARITGTGTGRLLVRPYGVTKVGGHLAA